MTAHDVVEWAVEVPAYMTLHTRTAIDPHEDGQVFCLLGGEDVEVQAVLVGVRIRGNGGDINPLTEGILREPKVGFRRVPFKGSPPLAVLALHFIAGEANELLEGLKPSRASLS